MCCCKGMLAVLTVDRKSMPQYSITMVEKILLIRNISIVACCQIDLLYRKTNKIDYNFDSTFNNALASFLECVR